MTIDLAEAMPRARRSGMLGFLALMSVGVLGVGDWERPVYIDYGGNQSPKRRARRARMQRKRRRGWA